MPFTFQNWSGSESAALIKVAENASVIVQGFSEYSIRFCSFLHVCYELKRETFIVRLNRSD